MKKHPKFRKSLSAVAKPQNRAFYVDALMGALSGVILTVLGVAIYAPVSYTHLTLPTKLEV